MPVNVPVPDRSAGDVFTETLWDSYIRDNVNKLLDRGHRVLTVAQFLALTGLEDGDEAYVEVDGSAGVLWHLRYHAASSKWRHLGGPELVAHVATSEGRGSTSYGDLATVGPSIVVPFAGDFDIELEARCMRGSNNAAAPVFMSYATAAITAVDANGAQHFSGGDQEAVQARRRQAGIASGATVTAKYRHGDTTGGTSTWSQRFLRIKPVAVTNA